MQESKGDYENDEFEETSFIEDLNDDNQDDTEGGDSLSTGGAGSSVSGPSRDTVVEQVRKVVAGTQDQGGVDNPGFVRGDIRGSTIYGDQYGMSLSESVIVDELERFIRSRHDYARGFKFDSIGAIRGLIVDIRLDNVFESRHNSGIWFRPRGVT